MKLGDLRKQLVDEGFTVRKFGRLNLMRLKEKDGLSIAKHDIILQNHYII